MHTDRTLDSPEDDSLSADQARILARFRQRTRAVSATVNRVASSGTFAMI